MCQRRITCQLQIHFAYRTVNLHKDIITAEARCAVQIYVRQKAAGINPYQTCLIQLKVCTQIFDCTLIGLNRAVNHREDCAALDINAALQPDIIQIAVVQMYLRAQHKLHIEAYVGVALTQLGYRRHVNQHIIQTQTAADTRAEGHRRCSIALTVFHIRILLRLQGYITRNRTGENLGGQLRLICLDMQTVGCISIGMQCIAAFGTERALA